MSPAVNQECVVQCVRVSEHEAYVVSVPEAFAPQIPRQHCRHDNRNDRHDDPVVSENRIKMVPMS